MSRSYGRGRGAKERQRAGLWGYPPWNAGVSLQLLSAPHECLQAPVGGRRGAAAKGPAVLHGNKPRAASPELQRAHPWRQNTLQRAMAALFEYADHADQGVDRCRGRPSTQHMLCLVRLCRSLRTGSGPFFWLPCRLICMPSPSVRACASQRLNRFARAAPSSHTRSRNGRGRWTARRVGRAGGVPCRCSAGLRRQAQGKRRAELQGGENRCPECRSLPEGDWQEREERGSASQVNSGEWLRRTPFAPPAHAAFLCLCRPSHGRRCLIAPPSASLQAWLRCVLLQSTLRQGSCGLLPARSLAVAAVEKGPAMSAVTPVAPSQCLMPSTKGNIALSAPPRLQSKRTLGCLAPCYATPPLVSPRSPAQATLRRCKGVSHFPTLLFLATPRSCRAYRGHAKPGLG